MNLGQMQALVKLTAGNLDSSSPFYVYIYPPVGSESQSVINIAAADVVRMAIGPNARNFDLFPELKNTWKVGPTVTGSNIIARPADCIVVTNISSAQAMGPSGGSTIVDPLTWDTTQEIPLNYQDPYLFGTLTKNSTVTGYARIFTRKGKSIIINPTPSANFLDYLRFYGIAKPVNLVNATDEFYIDEDFHDAIVTMAAHRLALKMGRPADAQNHLTAANMLLATRKDMTAEEEFTRPMHATVDGIPTRSSVYGEN